jgi:hypothetical protein
MASAEELKVDALGSRVVSVRAGPVEGLRAHMGLRGFPAGLTPASGSGLDRLDLERHADGAGAQAALDEWPH